LEERRSRAVQTRRGSGARDDLGALDADAIARVRDEVRPDPRDADELHDALMTAGALRDDEGPAGGRPMFGELTSGRRGAPARWRYVVGAGRAAAGAARDPSCGRPDSRDPAARVTPAGVDARRCNRRAGARPDDDRGTDHLRRARADAPRHGDRG